MGAGRRVRRVRGLLPHRLSDDEEGERRVFHVALTRAIRQVLVLADADEPSPFLAELDGGRPHDPIARAPRVGRGPEGGRRDRSRPSEVGARQRRSASRPAPSSPSVSAAVGVVLEYGGHTGSVVDLTDSAAVIRVGDAHLKVPFGADVRVDGLTAVLVAPDGEAGAAGPAQACEAALREWRSEAAKRATVPAYVVLNDNELIGIAGRRPTTLAELARCKGMGPIRLERWGDELLSVLSTVDTE